MQIKGKLHAVLEHKQISDTFSTLSFVILVDDNPQYPEYISVQATNERIPVVQQLQIGQEVTLDCNLKGRPWTNKEGVTRYFNTIDVWKITPTGQQVQQSQGQGYNNSNNNIYNNNNQGGNGNVNNNSHMANNNSHANTASMPQSNPNFGAQKDHKVGGLPF